MIEDISPHLREAIHDKLKKLYGEQQAGMILARLDTLLAKYPTSASKGSLNLSEQDALVISYGDHIQRVGEAPLATLRQVLQQLALPLSGIHILPFYPYSSDDGFSVIDYYQVDPALGTWEDIRALCADFRVMFDAVFNHISVYSNWFQAFLRGEIPYNDYFITADPQLDLSLVTRPRTLPLLTAFDTADGQQFVWTTFSEDQADLNFANPLLLLDMLDVLLFYVNQGASLIRLDAIAFLWKQIGTTCIHLPQTHLIVQLMRDVLDMVAPDTILVTETNVPHQENMSYFGDGSNEAQIVYQFPLPPLILHTLHSGDATRITDWAATIERASETTTFFNFTASHDGIGIRPVSGILKESEIDALVDLTLAHGGFVSYKNNSDGSQSPYELNITCFDAVTDPAVTAHTPDIAVQRFMLSQSIMLAFIGAPGIYLHSVLASRNERAGVEQTGRNRSINREKLAADPLLAELSQPESLRAKVFEQYRQLLEVRTHEAAFHPLGAQTVHNLHASLFTLERTSPDGSARVLALHNVSAATVSITPPVSGKWQDLLSGEKFETTSLTLTPYQILWLKQI